MLNHRFYRQMHKSDESLKVNFYYWTVFEDVDAPSLAQINRSQV